MSERGEGIAALALLALLGIVVIGGIYVVWPIYNVWSSEQHVDEAIKRLREAA